MIQKINTGGFKTANKKRRKNKFYHKTLEKYFKHIIPENTNVLELGCGKGDLLNAVNPKRGLGLDFSQEMVNQAQKKYPDAYVLSQNTGAIRNYQRDPYGKFLDKNSYYNKGGAFFPLMAERDRLKPKTMVRGLVGEKSQTVVSWEEVRRKKVVNIDIEEINLENPP